MDTSLLPFFPHVPAGVVSKNYTTAGECDMPFHDLVVYCMQLAAIC